MSLYLVRVLMRNVRVNSVFARRQHIDLSKTCLVFVSIDLQRNQLFPSRNDNTKTRTTFFFNLPLRIKVSFLILGNGRVSHYLTCDRFFEDLFFKCTSWIISGISMGFHRSRKNYLFGLLNARMITGQARARRLKS